MTEWLVAAAWIRRGQKDGRARADGACGRIPRIGEGRCRPWRQTARLGRGWAVPGRSGSRRHLHSHRSRPGPRHPPRLDRIPPWRGRPGHLPRDRRGRPPSGNHSANSKAGRTSVSENPGTAQRGAGGVVATGLGAWRLCSPVHLAWIKRREGENASRSTGPRCLARLDNHHIKVRRAPGCLRLGASMVDTLPDWVS